MSLWGADVLEFSSFAGGVVFPDDTDPTEIDPDQADGSGTVNVDFRTRNLAIRRGWSYYNSTAPASAKIWGLGRYYPRDGSTARYLVAGSTKVWASTDATFDASDEITTGLTGGSPMDFIQYKANLYFGNGVDAFQRWDGNISNDSVAVALVVAPTATPGLDPMQSILESFDSADPETAWSEYNPAEVLDDAKITLATEDEEIMEGTRAMRATFIAGSEGFSAQKVFSSAATVDLSHSENLLIWYKANNRGISFKVGIKKNAAATVDFKLFPVFKSGSADDWFLLRVPLSGIAAADRTASPGIGIKLISPGRKGFNSIFVFDQAMGDSGIPIDTYHYYMTYGVSERINNFDVMVRESNPGPEETITLADFPPTGGVMVTPTTSGESGVNIIRFWRFRDHGTFRRARLVGTAPNATTTLNDADGISTTDTAIVLTSAVGYSKGAVIQIGTEKMIVNAVSGSTLTVSRAFEGTVAATAANGATITFVKLLDTKSDGELVQEAAEEMVGDQLAPPLGYAHCLANDRMHILNVTIGGARYPWRMYISRQGFPEQFSNIQNPRLGPDVPGWIDIPTHDHIRRAVEFDGDVLVFCDRSIWSLQGSGWNDYALRQRAYYGLDAREAVVKQDRYICFLATDGVRVLAPNKSFDGLFETWLIDEPVNSKMRDLSAANRLLVAFGVDDLQRIWCCYARSGSTNNTALVFDPFIGSLSPQYNAKRRGWHYYTNIPASVFYTLKKGGGDLGQMIGGDVATVKIIQFRKDSAGAVILTDNAVAIDWSWQSRAVDAGDGGVLNWVYVSGAFDANAGANVTFTPILNGRASGHSVKLVLGGEHTGYSLPDTRVPDEVRGRVNAVKVGGAQSTALICRGIKVGYYEVGTQ